MVKSIERKKQIFHTHSISLIQKQTKHQTHPCSGIASDILPRTSSTPLVPQSQIICSDAEDEEQQNDSQSSSESDNESIASSDGSDADFQVDENADEENSEELSDEQEEEKTVSPSRKKRVSAINKSEKPPKCPSLIVSEASDILSIEPETSIASSATLFNVPSPPNSSLQVPDVSDCVANAYDPSAIQILRLGTNKTKSYPCGLCADGTWFTKPQRHFSRCHKKEALFQEIQRLKETTFNPVSTRGEVEEANERIKVLQTTLLNQAVKKHNDQVIREKKSEFFYYFAR